nr:stage II sporulation protein M [Chitinophagaceae bacterium]
ANNIRVALMAFALGIVACVGTLYILFSNGLMLGTFQHMFFAKGLGWKSILVVWIHGTIEISAIVIAGTAGLIIGNAFLFPGTYSRTDSLKIGAKDAVKVIIGLIPFFLIAAFFEGFITRHTEMPVWLSLLILIGSALLIIWYFIVYPILLGKSGIQVVKGEVIYPEQHD